jgi:hypothetical protein
MVRPKIRPRQDVENGRVYSLVLIRTFPVRSLEGTPKFFFIDRAHPLGVKQCGILF